MISTGIKFVLLIFTFSVCSEASRSPHPDLYGKPCSNETHPVDATKVHCSLDNNMYCSEKGICECIIGERGRVFSHYHKTCIEVASTENSYACTLDIQCKLSKFGKYSRCNMDYDKCECHDENEKTIKVDDVCFIQMPKASRLARGLQGCSGNEDCQKSSLGELSRCNLASDVFECECYDTRSSGKQPVALYEGKCVIKKGLNEFCVSDDQCRAGYHKNAVCAEHPTYLPAEKVCICPERMRCDGNGSGAVHLHTQSLIMIIFSTILMGVVATKVVS